MHICRHLDGNHDALLSQHLKDLPVSKKKHTHWDPLDLQISQLSIVRMLKLSVL